MNTAEAQDIFVRSLTEKLSAAPDVGGLAVQAVVRDATYAPDYLYLYQAAVATGRMWEFERALNGWLRRRYMPKAGKKLALRVFTEVWGRGLTPGVTLASFEKDYVALANQLKRLKLIASGGRVEPLTVDTRQWGTRVSCERW